MNKNFLRAINDVKKQKEKEEKKKQPEEVEQQEEISSDEEKKLKQMGVQKKKIHKLQENKDNKWRHDRFKEQTTKITPKAPSQLRQLLISFEGNPGYSKIFPVVKHLKIYIRQIDDKRIVFNTLQAYQEAAKLFSKSQLSFTLSQPVETKNK